MEGEIFEEGAGGSEGLTMGDLAPLGDGGLGAKGVFGTGEGKPPPLVLPHFVLLQSTGRAASEEHSREER